MNPNNANPNELPIMEIQENLISSTSPLAAWPESWQALASEINKEYSDRSEIGRRLLEIKKSCKHGEFLPQLKAFCKLKLYFSTRSAHRAMGLYRAVSNGFMPADLEPVRHLPTHEASLQQQPAEMSVVNSRKLMARKNVASVGFRIKVDVDAARRKSFSEALTWLIANEPSYIDDLIEQAKRSKMRQAEICQNGNFVEALEETRMAA